MLVSSLIYRYSVDIFGWLGPLEKTESPGVALAQSTHYAIDTRQMDVTGIHRYFLA